MRWKYFSRWDCRKYDNAWYITCKSLYKNTQEKSTKDDPTEELKKQKTNLQKIKIIRQNH